MEKIAGDGATVDGHFQPANAALGEVATEITADWLNAVQDELVNVVESAGLVLDPDNHTQVLQAMKTLLGGSTRNALINGDFQLWQRKQSFSISDGIARYTADRWLASPGQNNTSALSIARNVFTLGQTTVTGDPRYYMVWNQGSGLNGNVDPILAQRVERAYVFNGRTVTFSFWAKVNTGTVNVTAKLRQSFGAGGSSDVTLTASAVVVATTWTRFTVVFDVPTTAGKTFVGQGYLEASLTWAKTANVTFNFADFQLELGDAPSEFERLPPQLVLALARRYYEKSYEIDTDPGTATYEGAQAGEESGTRFVAGQGRYLVPKEDFGSGVLVTFYNPETGTAAEIRWGASNVAITSVTAGSLAATGYPNCASQSSAKAYVQWTAEAEIT